MKGTALVPTSLVCGRGPRSLLDRVSARNLSALLGSLSTSQLLQKYATTHESKRWLGAETRRRVVNSSRKPYRFGELDRRLDQFEKNRSSPLGRGPGVALSSSCASGWREGCSAPRRSKRAQKSGLTWHLNIRNLDALDACTRHE